MEINKDLNIRGNPALEEFALGAFGSLAASAVSVDIGALYPVTVSLEGLAKVGKPMPAQVISTLAPPLCSLPHGLVSILNITWKKLFRCHKNSIV